MFTRGERVAWTASVRRELVARRNATRVCHRAAGIHVYDVIESEWCVSINTPRADVKQLEA